MTWFHGFGNMLEDDLEKSHQDMDQFHQRNARLGNSFLHAISYSHSKKTVNDNCVQAAIKDIKERTTKKRKTPTTESSAQLKIISEKSTWVTKWLQNLASEQTKPAEEAFVSCNQTKKELIESIHS
eukprot:15345241-Ditylum_brightwellii.AAC.1